MWDKFPNRPLVPDTDPLEAMEGYWDTDMEVPEGYWERDLLTELPLDSLLSEICTSMPVFGLLFMHCFPAGSLIERALKSHPNGSSSDRARDDE
jgi:hypothetical protein